MSTVIEQVKQLALPQDQYVVIGSGLLDALGLRDAHDVDLVVSEPLFQALIESGKYTLTTRHGQAVLESGPYEIWRDWSAELPFEILRRDAIIIEGVTFAHPSTIIERKAQRGSEKDLKDIALLKEYYQL